MNKASKYGHNLINILQTEIALVDESELIEHSIMDSVLNNRWDTLELSLEEAGILSIKIESLDNKRNKCIDLLKELFSLGKEDHFYRLTVNLESELRDKLNNLYRELKISVLNLRNMNWRINAYVGTVTGIMKQTLKEIYPNRRGSLYSRAGIIREAGNNPMVLNREL